MANADRLFFVACLLFLTGILARIAVVDWKTQRIPNSLNVALWIFGLLTQVDASVFAIGIKLLSSLSVMAIFWVIREIHMRLTGRVGLGLGDVKMAAASAVWLPLLAFPLFLLLSSFSALIFLAIRAIAFGPDSINRRLAFGPFLSAGLLITWLASTQGYLS